MRRLPWLICALSLAASTALAIPAWSGKAPPRRPDAPAPPAYHFDRPPQLSMVAGSQIYVVDDRRVQEDEFRYGVFWYVYRDGWWYQSRHWNGPYAAIAARDVPRAILTVPPGRWKHRLDAAPELTTRRTPPAWVAEKERRIHGER
jgi:hypothetical protein